MANINDSNASNTVTGTDSNDVINGNGGDDVLIGLRGRDELFGGSGSDTFDYREAAFSESVPGEIIDGGTDAGTKDRIRVDGIVSFIGADIRSIEEIEFRAGTSFTSHRADLTASQFGAGKILSNARFDASAGDTNEIRITMGSTLNFDASQFVFQDWTAPTNVFRIIGDTSNENITLSSIQDTVLSGGGNDNLRNIRGADQVNAGSGSDALFVAANMTGALLDGGSDLDLLVLNADTDLRSADVRSIEALQFDPTSAASITAQVLSSQFSPTGLAAALAITGRANLADAITITTTATQRTIDASLWTFSNFADLADRITLNGSTGADTITGSSRRDFINGGALGDTIRGGLGADTLDGGTGDDTFIYGSSDGSAVNSEAPAGEILRGGSGIDTLKVLVPASTINSPRLELRQLAEISSIEKVAFEGELSILLLNSSQLGGDGLSSSLEITGPSFSNPNVQFNTVTFIMDTSTLDLAGLTLAGSIKMRVEATGIASAVTITGNTRSSEIIGNNFASTFILKGENDRVTGGTASDTFQFEATESVNEMNGIYNGGGGSDRMIIKSANAYQFVGQSIDSIENLEFAAGNNASSQVLFHMNLFQPNFNITADDGSYRILYIAFTSQSVTADASAFTFVNWGDDDKFELMGSFLQDTLIAAEDTATTLTGRDGDDTLTGGNGGDHIDGGLGQDNMFGSDGDDRFSLAVTADLATGETYDGGAGFDTIETQQGIFDFRTTTLASIEAITAIGEGASQWRFEASQIGSGLASNATIKEVDATATTQLLDVHLGAALSVNLSGFIFDSTWDSGLTADDDRVRIFGNADDETITGTGVSDTVQSGNGDDIIDAGGGNDLLIGGLGKDRMTGGTGEDQFRFTSASESNTAATRDIITDFTSGEDLINLRLIDANELVADDQNFVLDVDGIVSAGEFRIRQLANTQLIEFNTDADAAFEFLLQVNGVGRVTGEIDFVL